MSIASVGGGALAGAVGSALGSPLQGIGNAIYFGDEYSVKQWGTDVLVGGVAGGVAGGIAGLRNNARWAAKGLSKNSLLTGKELPRTDALGNVVPDGFTAQFPEYTDLTPGGRYTYSNPAATGGADAVKQVAVHGNSLQSLRPTWGYKLFLQDGTFLKNGITSKLVPEARYTKSFMSDKFMEKFPFTNRLDAWKWEFQQNQILRGPLNKNMH